MYRQYICTVVHILPYIFCLLEYTPSIHIHNSVQCKLLLFTAIAIAVVTVVVVAIAIAAVLLLSLLRLLLNTHQLLISWVTLFPGPILRRSAVPKDTRTSPQLNGSPESPSLAVNMSPGSRMQPRARRKQLTGTFNINQILISLYKQLAYNKQEFAAFGLFRLFVIHSCNGPFLK